MNKKYILWAIIACAMIVGCGKKTLSQEKTDAISTFKNEAGDSTIYGLACEGCTDSILVLLPWTGGDPDTLNVIRAFQEHRIYGRPRIGDDMAVILNADSIHDIRMAININRLHGEWCYLVTPTLRHRQPDAPALPDSIMKRIMKPREYSLRLKSNGIAYSKGNGRQQGNDGMSPVVYPRIKRYTGWHLFNGHLILTPDSMSRQSPDTANIVLMRRDSLVLQFKDHEQAYYRKATPDPAHAPAAKR